MSASIFITGNIAELAKKSKIFKGDENCNKKSCVKFAIAFLTQDLSS